MDNSEFPRSIRGDVTVGVVFQNKSGRDVDLCWINHQGMLISYGTILSNRNKGMSTYETHPWVARDSKSGLPLLLNGDKVFQPVSVRDGQEVGQGDKSDIVNIQIPGQLYV